MNKTKNLAVKIGFVLCSALLGYTTYGQPSVAVGVSVSMPSVEIRAASDFYEPLAPQGEWVVIGSYGRCWRPGHVARDWRPYCNGNWQRTDDGWYWVSDEPWAWATYHYGRWDFNDQYGWYWVPQTQWAPAWVSWHSGGGYVGWAPLYPSGVVVISPRAYVFVEERHFMEPVRSSTVIAYNTTIINKTVMREAPATAVIEKASKRKIQAVPVQELRRKEEASVIARQRTPVSAGEKKVQTPVRNEAQPAEKKSVAAHASPQIEKPAVTTREFVAPIPKNGKVQSETRKSVPALVESKPATKAETRPEARPVIKSQAGPAAKPEAKPEARFAPKSEANHPTPLKESAGQNANQHPAKQEKSVQPSDQRAHGSAEPPAREKTDASENNGTDPLNKNHENKVKE